MLVLGIESSCDETAAAVVRDGREVLSSAIHTQIALHAPHGGVVPEIASRSHIEKIPSVLRKALDDAKVSFSDIDAVAATYGPGLASSLLVGFSAAKGIAAAIDKPLIAINHVEAHIYSAFLSQSAPPITEALPLLSLVVSGGHSAIVRTGADRVPHILGQTLDDAAGEAFDKASKMLGLGYPGGPAIQKAADAAANHGKGISFPKGRISGDNPSLGSLTADFCFSFSGLKTSLRNYIQKHPVESEADRDEIAAAYQDAIVNALADRCALALSRGRYAGFSAGGGVSLNSALRARLAEVAAKAHVPLFLPEPRFCGDNAAMIAALAGSGIGIQPPESWALDASPNLTF